ncbi:hypothetical protein ABPG72_001417 [Tetrahymena utriculariae]
MKSDPCFGFQTQSLSLNFMKVSKLERGMRQYFSLETQALSQFSVWLGGKQLLQRSKSNCKSRSNDSMIRELVKLAVILQKMWVITRQNPICFGSLGFSLPSVWRIFRQIKKERYWVAAIVKIYTNQNKRILFDLQNLEEKILNILSKLFFNAISPTINVKQKENCILVRYFLKQCVSCLIQVSNQSSYGNQVVCIQLQLIRYELQVQNLLWQICL